jgi:hypothetical protein
MMLQSSLSSSLNLVCFGFRNSRTNVSELVTSVALSINSSLLSNLVSYHLYIVILKCLGANETNRSPYLQSH